MIDGFEDLTYKLTENELQIAQVIIAKIRSNIGESMAVTNDRMGEYLKTQGFKVDGPRIRKIISFIRIHKLVTNLVATSKGYYIENDPELLRLYQKSLRHRCDGIMAIHDSYNDYLKQFPE